MSQDSTGRNFQRVKYDVEAVLEIENVEHKCKLLDLSLKGAMLEVDAADVLSVGEQGRLSFSLGDEEHEIAMDVEIAHREISTVGVHCLQLDLDSATHLRRIIELYTGDSQIMEREIGAMLSRP